MSKKWLEVDRAGLAEIARRRGMDFVVTEPIQNAWDEADVTRVEITLTPVRGVPQADLVVVDDAPDGFRDLAESYTMFRASYKLANPEQRGRFNVGEKLLLAVAEAARIESTTGSVIFGPNGRTTGRTRRESGTMLSARLRMTRAEYDGAVAFVRRLIPPAGIVTTFNGEPLTERTPVAAGDRRLLTEIAAPEGGFSYTRRTTSVRVYAPQPGEEPHLYEMGIPVDRLDCAWHVEVAQKVPLAIDRSSVRQSYVKSVQTAAAELMADAMTEEQARGAWVTTALGETDDDRVVKRLIRKRFGERVVTYDPSAPESNKLAMDAGYSVVRGGELPKDAWDSVRRAEALAPAGRLFPDGKVRTDPNGTPPLDQSEWTDEMRRVAEYADSFAMHTCDGRRATISFYRAPGAGFAAMCGAASGISFNLSAGGMDRAVRELDQAVIDALLIHECAHFRVSDHLTHEFHRECCRIGALARTLEAWL